MLRNDSSINFQHVHACMQVQFHNPYTLPHVLRRHYYCILTCNFDLNQTVMLMYEPVCVFYLLCVTLVAASI